MSRLDGLQIGPIRFAPRPLSPEEESQLRREEFKFMQEELARLQQEEEKRKPAQIEALGKANREEIARQRQWMLENAGKMQTAEELDWKKWNWKEATEASYAANYAVRLQLQKRESLKQAGGVLDSARALEQKKQRELSTAVQLNEQLYAATLPALTGLEARMRVDPALAGYVNAVATKLGIAPISTGAAPPAPVEQSPFERGRALGAAKAVEAEKAGGTTLASKLWSGVQGKQGGLGSLIVPAAGEVVGYFGGPGTPAAPPVSTEPAAPVPTAATNAALDAIPMPGTDDPAIHKLFDALLPVAQDPGLGPVVHAAIGKGPSTFAEVTDSLSEAQRFIVSSQLRSFSRATALLATVDSAGVEKVREMARTGLDENKKPIEPAALQRMRDTIALSDSLSPQTRVQIAPVLNHLSAVSLAGASQLSYPTYSGAQSKFARRLGPGRAVQLYSGQAQAIAEGRMEDTPDELEGAAASLIVEAALATSQFGPEGANPFDTAEVRIAMPDGMPAGVQDRVKLAVEQQLQQKLQFLRQMNPDVYSVLDGKGQMTEAMEKWVGAAGKLAGWDSKETAQRIQEFVEGGNALLDGRGDERQFMETALDDDGTQYIARWDAAEGKFVRGDALERIAPGRTNVVHNFINSGPDLQLMNAAETYRKYRSDAPVEPPTTQPTTQPTTAPATQPATAPLSPSADPQLLYDLRESGQPGTLAREATERTTDLRARIDAQRDKLIQAGVSRPAAEVTARWSSKPIDPAFPEAKNPSSEFLDPDARNELFRSMLQKQLDAENGARPEEPAAIKIGGGGGNRRTSASPAPLPRLAPVPELPPTVGAPPKRQPATQPAGPAIPRPALQPLPGYPNEGLAGKIYGR